MKIQTEKFFCFVGGLGIGLIVGGLILCAVNNTSQDRKKRAIEISCGQYNSTTGVFEYTDKNVKYILLGKN